jgi:predicted nucleotidyltransferase
MHNRFEAICSGSYKTPMNPHDIIAKVKHERAALDQLGVASLRLFGSVARGEGGPQSDADFIVRFRDPPTFDRYMDLKFLLEQVVGTRVDLVTEDALRPALRQAVEQDAVRVA